MGEEPAAATVSQCKDRSFLFAILRYGAFQRRSRAGPECENSSRLLYDVLCSQAVQSNI